VYVNLDFRLSEVLMPNVARSSAPTTYILITRDQDADSNQADC